MSACWTAAVISFFPELWPGALGVSVFDRARQQGKWQLQRFDIRAAARERLDAPPCGGGPGMILRADTAARALALARANPAVRRLPLIYPSAAGEVFDQTIARELADGGGALFLCGRYEGVDQRLLEAHGAREISLGDFVLASGDSAALVMAEAALRLVPGILGRASSLAEESFAASPYPLLEHPHYAPPARWQGRDVPPVLLRGDHQAIAQWRRQQAEARTLARRPDLWLARFGKNVL